MTNKLKYEGSPLQRRLVSQGIYRLNCETKELRAEERAWRQFNEEKIPAHSERPVEDAALSNITGPELMNHVKGALLHGQLGVIASHYVYDKDFEEIAAHIGTTRSNVNAINNRAVYRLSTRLPKRFMGELKRDSARNK